MPAIIGVVAVWPLRDAVVCGVRTTSADPYAAAARFVGETKERVDVGDSGNRRIISIPASRVSRVIIGEDAATLSICDRNVDPPPRN